jgi:DNA repair ATPase RecN
MAQTFIDETVITVADVRKHLKHHVDELKISSRCIEEATARIDAIKTLTGLLAVLDDMNV